MRANITNKDGANGGQVVAVASTMIVKQYPLQIGDKTILKQSPFYVRKKCTSEGTMLLFHNNKDAKKKGGVVINLESVKIKLPFLCQYRGLLYESKWRHGIPDTS